MDKERALIIINNLLSEITKTIDMDEKTYYSWLRTEIGITEEEIKELKENGLFPIPLSVA